MFHSKIHALKPYILPLLRREVSTTGPKAVENPTLASQPSVYAFFGTCLIPESLLSPTLGAPSDVTLSPLPPPRVLVGTEPPISPESFAKNHPCSFEKFVQGAGRTNPGFLHVHTSNQEKNQL